MTKEYRAVHIKDGYVVAPDKGDPRGWVSSFPAFYRLESREVTEWAVELPQTQETPKQ